MKKTLTILDIIQEYMFNRCSKGESVEFDDIFAEVETKLKSKWEAQTNNFDYDETKTEKIGEVYRLLTVSSDFVRNPDATWTIRLSALNKN